MELIPKPALYLKLIEVSEQFPVIKTWSKTHWLFWIPDSEK